MGHKLVFACTGGSGFTILAHCRLSAVLTPFDAFLNPIPVTLADADARWADTNLVGNAGADSH